MDSLEIFFKSLVIGFFVALPVGPVGVLVIRRSLTNGWRWAFTAGLSAALADGLYSGIATRGLNSVTRLVTQHKDPLEISGGILLILIAWQMFSTAARPVAPDTNKEGGLWQDCLSAFVLMIVNPVTIFIFLALLATLGVHVTRRHGGAELIVAGIMLGSAFWWLILSLGAGLFKKNLKPEHLKILDYVAGTLMGVFGVVKIIQGIFIH